MARTARRGGIRSQPMAAFVRACREHGLTHPAVVASALLAAVLSVLWVLLLTIDLGDAAAQSMWAGFGRHYPGHAYDFSWYGGCTPASYSVLSPYIMGYLGIRPTGVLAFLASAVLGAWWLTRMPLRHPLILALVLTFSLWEEILSGRITFALGTCFALAALALLLPASRFMTRTGAAVFVLSAVSALCSPLAGAFLGIPAAALLITGRRREACCLAAGPGLVIAAVGVLFPLHGFQPYFPGDVALTLEIVVATGFAVPARWRVLRLSVIVLAGAVVAAILVATPVGSNIGRLPRIGAATVLAAAALGTVPDREGARAREGGRRLLAGAAFLMAAGVWLVAEPTIDVTGGPSRAVRDVTPLVAELRSLGAQRERVEVVPLRNHWEAWGVGRFMSLARGWNRQLDVGYGALFYSGQPFAYASRQPFTSAGYHSWLLQNAVAYVAVAAAPPDYAGVDEYLVLAQPQPWLTPVWQSGAWRLFRVADAQPLAQPPATVQDLDPASMTLDAPGPATILLRVHWSPWLKVHSPAGTAGACLAPAGEWTTLRTHHAGRYRVTGEYTLPRGSPCA